MPDNLSRPFWSFQAKSCWYYAPQMTEDEVLLIKSWDSLGDGRARFTPHAAFNPPRIRKDAPARESIEVRTFVVIDQKTGLQAAT